MAFNSDNLTKENNEVFGMLEKMTERLLQIERCNRTNLLKEQLYEEEKNWQIHMKDKKLKLKCYNILKIRNSSNNWQFKWKQNCKLK